MRDKTLCCWQCNNWQAEKLNRCSIEIFVGKHRWFQSLHKMAQKSDDVRSCNLLFGGTTWLTIFAKKRFRSEVCTKQPEKSTWDPGTHGSAIKSWAHFQASIFPKAETWLATMPHVSHSCHMCECVYGRGWSRGGCVCVWVWVGGVLNPFVPMWLGPKYTENPRKSAWHFMVWR